MADSQSIKLFLNPVKEAEMISETQPKITIFEFVEGLIKRLKEDNKFGNAWVYSSTINALKAYYPSPELYLSN